MHTSLRIFFVCLLMSMAGATFAQTDLLIEDFEGGALPADWSRSQQPNSVGWLFGTTAQMSSSFFSISNTNTTRVAASNDDKYDNSSATANNASVDYLITPSFDLTSNAAVFVEFQSFQTGDYGSEGSLEISTDSGATWISVYTVPESENWEDNLVNISIFNTSTNVMVGFRHNDNGVWADGFAIDNVRIFEPAANDANMLGLNVEGYYPVGSVDIAGSFQNLGALPITSVDISYSVNGGAAVTETVSGLNIMSGAAYNFTHGTPFSLVDPIEHEVVVWVSNLNGGVDGNLSNDTLGSSVFGVSSVPVKNVLIEDHTGAWCQFCPDGTVTINNIVATNPNAIAVSVHNGDAMVIPAGTEIQNTFSGGYPKAVVDHYEFPNFPGIATSSRSQWAARVNQRATAIVPISVGIERAGWDSTTRTISAVLNAAFLGEVTAEMRVNLWILEDSVVGVGSGYNQVNFYNTSAGHPFQGAGNPIIGFVHDYTLRQTLGGAWGIENSLPPSGLADGQSYSLRFDHVLPASFDEKHIRLVAMVQQFDLFNPANRPIINSAEVLLPLATLPPPTSIEDELAPRVLNVYPNPFSDRLAIEYDLPKTGDVEIVVMDLYGRKIATLANGTMAKGMNTTYWNGYTQTGGSVPNGVYLIRIESQGVSTHHKVTLAK